MTGYFPAVLTYGQFTSGHIGHTKMPLFELSMNSIKEKNKQTKTTTNSDTCQKQQQITIHVKNNNK
jgi:hypothetical protein